MPATSLLTKAFQFDVMEDRALFMSDTFITYLKNTLASMTGSKVYVLQVVWEPDNDDIAHTDGRMVFLNVGHPYVRHFKKQKMRFIYVMHMLFHEIGHLLDADLSRDFQKVLGKIATREHFFQLPPVLTNEELEALKALKNPLLTNIFFELARTAYNCGLDTHDETAMANNYSAYVEQSFAVGLQVDMAKMPTLKQMRDAGETEISVITSLMFQYIRFGQLIMDDTEESWNDPAVKFVMEYRSSLDELRYADDPFVRQLALFRVLAAIWAMIRDQYDIPPMLPPMSSSSSSGDDNSQDGHQNNQQSDSDKSDTQNNSSDSGSSNTGGQGQNNSSSEKSQSGDNDSNASDSQKQNSDGAGAQGEGASGADSSKADSQGHENGHCNSGSENQNRAGSKDGNTSTSDTQGQCSSGMNAAQAASQGQNSGSGVSNAENQNDSSVRRNSSGSEASKEYEQGSSTDDSMDTASSFSQSRCNSDFSQKESNDTGTREGQAASQNSGKTGQSSASFPSAQELEDILEQIKAVGEQFMGTAPQNVDGKSLKVGNDRRPIRKTDLGEKAAESLACQIETSMTQAIMDANKNADGRTDSNQEVSNIVSTQDANSSHAGIPVDVIRSAASIESVKEPYNQLYAKVSGYADRAAQEVKQMFEEIREGTTLRSRRTGRVDSRGLSRIVTNQRIFFTKKAPSDEDDMAICLLIDQSGSMNGINEGMERSKIAYARETAIMLEAFARKANIPLFICGHSMRNGKMNFFVHKSFESTNELDRYALSALSAGGNNRDGYAIYIACEMLAKRPESDKLFIILSDGLPNDSSYGGDKAAKDIRAIVDLARRKHEIETLAAAIGDDRDRIKAIYGNSYLDVTDLAALPKTLTRLIRERIE